MPAILAATALMGIIGFVVCAFSTWILFQQRTEFAIRTLRGTYLAEIEQSHLDPESKSAVVKEIEALAADLERGKYEDWQAAGVMQRLQRLPVLQWGELQAVEAFVRSEAYSTGVADTSDGGENAGDPRAVGIKHLSRLRRAVELGKVTSFDFEDLLQPVRRADPAAPSGHTLIQPMTIDSVNELIHRARLLADRAEIPDQDFDDIRIESIVGQQIELGASEGSF